jgi:hypothetical protein
MRRSADDDSSNGNEEAAEDDSTDCTSEPTEDDGSTEEAADDPAPDSRYDRVTHFRSRIQTSRCQNQNIHKLKLQRTCTPYILVRAPGIFHTKIRSSVFPDVRPVCGHGRKWFEKHRLLGGRSLKRPRDVSRSLASRDSTAAVLSKALSMAVPFVWAKGSLW